MAKKVWSGFWKWLCLVLALTLPATARDPSATKPNFAFINTFPFYYFNEDGEQTGFNYDIAKWVFGELKLDANYFGMPVGRALRELNAGTQDMTVSYRMPELFPDIHYFATVGCQQISLLPIKNSGIAQLKDIVGKRVTYVLGGRFDRLYGHRKDFVRMPARNTESMFRLAVRGRTDALVLNNMAFESLRRAPPPGQGLADDTWTLFNPPILVMPMEVSFSISKKSHFKHLVPVIEAFVEQARAKDQFAPIFKKYGEMTGGNCQSMVTKDTMLPHE